MTVTCFFCCFCAYIQVLANETFSWSLPTGNRYDCPSSLNHPSFSCLSKKGGGPGKGQNWSSPSRKWDQEATLMEHLDCYSGAFISGVFVAKLFEMFNKAL